MLVKTDAQRMAISYQELLRLRDKHILKNLDTSNAFNLFSEISGFYYSKGAGVMLGHIMQAKPWDYEEIETYRKKPNAIIYDKCNWQDVSLSALAYIDRNLSPIMKEYGTGCAYDYWLPLMNGFNFFLEELIAKMMFKECDAMYYHDIDRYCFCLDTSRALKSLRLIKR